jgi:hypothetical protein
MGWGSIGKAFSGAAKKEKKINLHKTNHSSALKEKKALWEKQGEKHGPGGEYRENTSKLSKEDKAKYRNEHPEQYDAHLKDKSEIAGYQRYRDGKNEIKNKEGGFAGFMGGWKGQVALTGAMIGAPMLIDKMSGSKDDSQDQPPPPYSQDQPPPYSPGGYTATA